MCLSRTQVKEVYREKFQAASWIAEASSKIHVYFCGTFPKRKIYAVNTCQFCILCSVFNYFFIAAIMSEVVIFSLPRIIKKTISNHRLFMEFTPFLTFCGGISSGPGIICCPVGRSSVGRDHLRACTDASLAGDFCRPASEKK